MAQSAVPTPVKSKETHEDGAKITNYSPEDVHDGTQDTSDVYVSE